MKSKKKRAVVCAYEKGYRVTEEGIMLNPNNKKLKGGLTNGYKTFTTKFEGQFISFKQHHLQAYQKFGEGIFKKGVHIRHLDGDRLNNSWDNIGIGTQSDNMMDRAEEDRVLNASNPIHNHEDILRDREEGYTYKELMIKYNISSKGTISFIINKSLRANKVL